PENIRLLQTFPKSSELRIYGAANCKFKTNQGITIKVKMHI
ncbi:hypothetical protein PsgB076_03030, partial [Pseudomonas savastanoi pv. glycinea str. B076]